MKKYHNFFVPYTQTLFTKPAPVRQHVKDAAVFVGDAFYQFILRENHAEEKGKTRESALRGVLFTLIKLKQAFSGDHELRELKALDAKTYREVCHGLIIPDSFRSTLFTGDLP